MAVDRTQVDLRADEGSRRPHRLRRPASGCPSTCRARSSASPCAAWAWASWPSRWWHRCSSRCWADRSATAPRSTWSVVLALLLTTVVQMVVGELIPKGIAVARPLSTALTLAGPFRIFAVVFKPVIFFCNATADGLLRLVGMEPTEELSSVRSREELQRLVRTSQEGGTLRDQAADILERSFRFGEKTAADALTPRMAVEALPLGASTGDLLDLSQSTGLSRFPVTGERPRRRRGHGARQGRAGAGPGAPAGRAAVPPGAVRWWWCRSPGSWARRPHGAAAGRGRPAGGGARRVREHRRHHHAGGPRRGDRRGHRRRARPPVPGAGGAHLGAGPTCCPDACTPTRCATPAGSRCRRAATTPWPGSCWTASGRIPAVGDAIEHEGWALEVAEMDHRRVAVVPAGGTPADLGVGEPDGVPS